MSITASYRRLSPSGLEQMRQDKKLADAYFGDDLEEDDDDANYAWMEQREASGRYLDIGKVWQDLNFLLIGSVEMKATNIISPLGSVVMGGTATEWEATYGMVRCLTPQEVKDCACALGQIDDAELRRRYDPIAFKAEDIYPGGEMWSERDIDFLLDTFKNVRMFFSEAAIAGEVILISIN